MQTPLVAIRSLVYNHEPYLRDYFEGIVSQQTNFPFIVVIHDDCSTDGSKAIIQEYAEKYPGLIRPIYEHINCYQNNLWSQAEQKIQQAYSNAKYVAYCEGDDYWTDSQKLQRQVDFLEANPDYVTIAENGLVHNTIVNKDYPFNTALSHDIALEEAISTPRFPTAGVVCRREALDGYLENCRTHVDIIQWCWLISKGKFRYENIISSVYRKGQQGMTVFIEPYAFLKKIESWNLEIMRIFDVKEDFIYTNIFKACINSVKLSIRQFAFGAAIKCALYSCKYAINIILAKLCLSSKQLKMDSYSVYNQ